MERSPCPGRAPRGKRDEGEGETDETATTAVEDWACEAPVIESLPDLRFKSLRQMAGF